MNSAQNRSNKKITETLSNQDLSVFEKLVSEYQTANDGTDVIRIAAAIALIAQGNEPLLLSEKEINFTGGQSSNAEKVISLVSRVIKITSSDYR